MIANAVTACDIPTFGGGLFYISDGVKGDRRFDDFTYFLDNRVDWVEIQVFSSVSRQCVGLADDMCWLIWSLVVELGR